MRRKQRLAGEAVISERGALDTAQQVCVNTGVHFTASNHGLGVIECAIQRKTIFSLCYVNSIGIIACVCRRVSCRIRKLV